MVVNFSGTALVGSAELQIKYLQLLSKQMIKCYTRLIAFVYSYSVEAESIWLYIIFAMLV